jgi:hypothetical protein
MNMNRLPIDYSSAHNVASAAHNWIFHPAWRNSPIMGDKPNQVTIKAANNSIVCPHSRSTFSDGARIGCKSVGELATRKISLVPFAAQPPGEVLVLARQSRLCGNRFLLHRGRF